MKLPQEIEHDSDCAMHNAPAYPTLPCDCTVEWLREDGKQEGAYEATLSVRAEVLRELLEWEAHYMQQARGGDQSGRSDARADAAHEIHDHLSSSWETRDKLAEHWSDCATSNGPAYPVGPCDCGAMSAAKDGA